MDTETPRLIIKFTQNIASKCLEIVPEISCIHNLDKIELNKETPLIEYTIPMTHKIKLEDHTDEEYFEEEKTYHSCVDLIDDEPIIENNKKLMRMLSDNNIVPHYINEYFNNHENKTRLAVKENKDACDDTNEQLSIYIDVPSNQSLKNNKHDKSTSSESDVQTLNSGLYKYDNLDIKVKTKTSNSTSDFIEIVRPSLKDVSALGFEKRLTRNSIYAFNTNPQDGNINKKLSMSHAHTVNAGENENPILIENSSRTSVICPVHSVPARCELKIKNCDFKQIVKFDKSVNLPNGKFSRFNCYYKDRIPPDVKFRYYKQLMEKEVSPLKTSLNNIVRKCMVLGVHDQLREAAIKPVAYNNKYGVFDIRQIDFTRSDFSQMEPNRGVFDIVFDD